MSRRADDAIPPPLWKETTLSAGVALLLLMAATGVNLERTLWWFGVLLALVPPVQVAWRFIYALDDNDPQETEVPWPQGDASSGSTRHTRRLRA